MKAFIKGSRVPIHCCKYIRRFSIGGTLLATSCNTLASITRLGVIESPVCKQNKSIGFFYLHSVAGITEYQKVHNNKT